MTAERDDAAAKIEAINKKIAELDAEVQVRFHHKDDKCAVMIIAYFTMHCF